MQKTRYSPEDEQLLMSQIWTPAIADDPEAFVMFMYPWGQKGTPLERFKGPRKWQREVLRELAKFVQENKFKDGMGLPLDALQDATASGRGIGKSALVSWLIQWMLSTRIGSSVIVSANSESQLRKVTWGELNKWSAMALNSHWWEVTATTLVPADWLVKLVERDLMKGTRYWGAEGKLWSSENPDAYAGNHNMDGMMVIFDEASGIDDPIWPVAKGFFTENIPNRYWFAFSNPRKNNGYFFECFHSKRGQWRTRQIDARTVEGTDKNVYKAIIDEYGENSYEANVEVYGEFPNESEEQFISGKVVKDAVARPKYGDASAPVILGVDPSRSHDKLVIYARQGRDTLGIKRYQGTDDLMVVVGYIIEAIKEFKPDATFIDEGGLGYGVVDRLNELGYNVQGVNFGWSSTMPAAYQNKRAEMWGEMKSWLRKGSIPDDKHLRADLVGPKRKPDSTGALALESKKDMRARGLPSPDTADALCVTFAFPVTTSRMEEQERSAVNRAAATRQSGFYNSNNTSTGWMGS